MSRAGELKGLPGIQEKFEIWKVKTLVAIQVSLVVLHFRMSEAKLIPI